MAAIRTMGWFQRYIFFQRSLKAVMERGKGESENEIAGREWKEARSHESGARSDRNSLVLSGEWWGPFREHFFLF